MFLQKTHSSVDAEKKWNDNFQGQFFFFHTVKQILVESAIMEKGLLKFRTNLMINQDAY